MTQRRLRLEARVGIEPTPKAFSKPPFGRFVGDFDAEVQSFATSRSLSAAHPNRQITKPDAPQVQLHARLWLLQFGETSANILSRPVMTFARLTQWHKLWHKSKFTIYK